MRDDGINRRNFVAGVALTVCGAALAGGACAGGCASDSGGSAEGAAAGLPLETDVNGTVDIGSPADYPHDGIYDRYASSHRIYLVRKDNRLHALRSICSHRACLVTPKDSHLLCPCHGSRFQLDGTVTKGPATRPLARYAIAKGEGGKLIVDKSKRFGPDTVDPAAAVLL